MVHQGSAGSKRLRPPPVESRRERSTRVPAIMPSVIAESGLLCGVGWYLGQPMGDPDFRAAETIPEPRVGDGSCQEHFPHTPHRKPTSAT